MNKSVILLSTLFAAGAASAHTNTQLGARAFHPGLPGLEAEGGCGSKTEGKDEKQASCGAKAKEGDAKAKDGSCGGKAKDGDAKAGTKTKAKADKTKKGDKNASCGAGTCGGKAKEGKDPKDAKENKGDAQASCGAKKDPKG
jgi:hypothetical protein